MAGVRKGTVLLGLAVALALIAGLAWNLLHTQDRARASLHDELGRRAGLTAKLIGSAFMAGNAPSDVRQRYGGRISAVRQTVRAHPANTLGNRLVILDATGRVIAAAPADLDAAGFARQYHVRRALAGEPTISDAFRDPRGRWAVELAIPIEAATGRRVVAGSAPSTIVQRFADGFFANASSVAGAHGFLVDGNGRTLSATGARTGPDRTLRTALAAAPSGTYGDREYVSAAVPSSRWRVILDVPSASLYASVDGGPASAAWLLFAAFAAAICALLALGLHAVRGARALTAATERERAAQQLAHERLHDALTGLPNRTLFQDRVEHAIVTARRHQRPLAVAFMDIDDFKRINDSLGHEAGDAVLREVARRLASSARAADTMSRFGGDEFVVLCEDTDESGVLQLVQRIEEALLEPVYVGPRGVPVTLSIGVALRERPDDARSASDLVRDADAAMYRAKELGRGRVEVFDGALHEQAVARLDAELALRQAIDAEQLVVHYQPIVALADGAAHGVEALVRWRSPETGELVPPGDFIPLAEHTGLIAPIGEWVLRTAIREVGEWARRGLVGDDFELSVNVSPRQLTDPMLPDVVADALRGWDRPAGRLCLEITESAMMLDPAGAQRTLERLAALGVRLALDDFGVGHSSLGQLARTLPISVLKLDRSFVAGMSGPRDRGIVEAAAALARALDLSSVAEGVESAEQASELAAMGFPYAQGFHFGRPVAADELAASFAQASSVN
jgi:diguanylate cyclase (GGDEF)-like protein